MRSFALALTAHRGYFADAALQAALDLDLPELFALTADPLQVAAARHLDAARLQRLCRVLVELGHLEEIGEGNSRWRGAAQPAQPVVRQGWGQLAQVIRSGQPLDAAAHLPAYQRAMAQDHAVTAREWALDWQAQLPKQGEVLDLGSGLGTWSRSLLDVADDWRAVLVDRPEVLALAAAHPRVELAPADAANLAWRQRFDLAVSAHLLHHLSDAQSAQVLQAAVQALRPGAWLALVEVFALPGQPAPDPALWFDLDMALYTTQGRVRTTAEIQAIAGDLPLQAWSLRVLDPQAGVAELRAQRRP